MSDMCMNNIESKLRCFKSKILLGALALAVIIGLGTVANAASDNNEDNLLSVQTGIFDPFTLQRKYLSTTQNASGNESGMESLMLLGGLNPPVKYVYIPFRPAIRTPFRPPMMLR